MFLKLGEMQAITPYNIQSSSSVPDIDPTVLAEMTKYASELKRIAPKANDFLYFSAVMMHAAEVALINKDGSPKKTRDGKIIEARWDIDPNGSWKWICNDPYTKPYCNANKDCFPETELVKAYKKWIGKPLCVDHKSSSVEHTRGFIVDTYYDRNLKRVVALCALDKINYPELARGVETGYKNAVSMGTGVERAVCFDCGKVAKCEADFCKHMQTKSGYCEINVGLNPLELSIVVNGADGEAQVKHIIAMVDTLNAYVDDKEKELAKISAKYTANLSYEAGEDLSKSGQKTSSISLTADDLVSLEKGIHKAIADFAAITKEKTLLDSNNAAYSQSGSAVAMPETENSGTDFSLAPPTVRFAMTDEQNKQLLQTMSSIDAKLTKLQQEYENLATTKLEGETMSGTNGNVKQGYFQGGGGLNEPTPGKVKYPIDPLSEEDRDNHDKQMVGQKPFPDVGPVDGMYPGYDSFPMGELERKKMLARAEAEERAMRRTAVIEKAKQAYFQNGEGANNPNTPTPHKVKYPIDPLEKEDRNLHDKQMVGQKPFPEVGPVDGMHPSPLSADQKDELKRKEMLQRAGLKARFTKAADLGASTWQIFGEDEKLLLSKTVDELTSGRTSELYAGVATEAFAKDLMSKIRSMGVEKVDALFKKAQVPPPSPMGDAPAVPALPAGDAPADAGKDGDPLDKVLELSDKVRDLGSDLAEAAHELKGEPAEMDMGEGAPQAANDASSAKSSGSVSTASPDKLQREIAAELSKEMLEVAAALTEHENELKAVARIYETNAITEANKDYLTAEINETIAEAEKTFASALELMGGYIKFAETVDSFNKRATREETMQPENKEIMGMLGETDASLRELASALDEGDLTAQAKKEESTKEDSSSADDLATMLADDFAADDEDADDADDAADDNEAIMVPDVATAAAVAKESPDASVEVKKASKEERVALRAKLASEMDKVNPIFYDFHPKGGETPSPLKAQQELAHVEDIEERHEKMMDVLHSTPQVKKQAAEIQDLVSAGKLQSEQVDQLASFGVDPAAVKYWKDFYGEMGPEGKTFAADLVKVHAKAQLDDEMNKHRVKLARAYELAYEMRDAGLISEARDAREACVNELMEMNDPAFDSMKKVVAQHAPAMKKQASVPQVGATSLFTDEPAPVVQDLRAQLDAAFSNSKPRAF